MKIEQKKEVSFVPVVITLESQAELDCLLVCLNMTDNVFNMNAESIQLLLGGGAAQARAAKLYGELYNQIEDLY